MSARDGLDQTAVKTLENSVPLSHGHGPNGAKVSWLSTFGPRIFSDREITEKLVLEGKPKMNIKSFCARIRFTVDAESKSKAKPKAEQKK